MHADFEHRIAATGLTRLAYATANSANGLRQALRGEAAVRQEAALIAVAAPVGLAIAPNPGWYVAMLAALFMLLIVELLNTAIEKLADHVTPDWNAKIGVVKDIGSAAVFVAILMAGLIWLTAAALRLAII
jgi:diacylglycerol kinase (ATP)